MDQFGDRKKEDMTQGIKQKLRSLPPPPSSLVNDPEALETLLQNPEQLRMVLLHPGVEQWLRANPQFLKGVLRKPQAQAMMQSHPEIKQRVEELLGQPIF